MSNGIDRRRAAFKTWLEANGGVSAVAERSKVPKTTLYSYLASKSQSLKGTTQDQIADAFGIPADEMFGGGARTVPLVGYVGAGAEAHFYAESDGPLDEVEAPPWATDQTRAAEIRGESLGPLFERWLVFYEDVRSPVTPDLHGRLCVVGLPNGKVLVKKLRPAGGGLFHLLSNAEEPMWDQEVAWAAVVKEMRPR
jgi:hypothetical protein